VSQIYVAPTEPQQLRELADVVSQHPERFGVDILINGNHHTVGIQRKTVADLVASLDDGRLAAQSVLMEGLAANEVVVLLEGRVRFNNDMLVLDEWGSGMSRRRFQRILSTLRHQGIHVHPSDDLDDTVHWVEVLGEWADVEHHSTLTPMTKTVKGDWGERKKKHYQVQVLMGMPGIGKGLAERIVDVLGGLPLVLKGNELKGVKGVGKKKYEAVKELFDDWYE
jgi:ERCC4-type nuclease